MRETWNWLTSLDAGFLFLLGLPFAVALLGLAKVAFEAKDESSDDKQSTP
jgi:hypothetical protein